MGEVIAKFRCNETQESGGGGTTAILTPVMPSDQDSIVTREENEKFWQATPDGKLEMRITNPQASNYFKQGQSYYLHFEEAAS